MPFESFAREANLAQNDPERCHRRSLLERSAVRRVVARGCTVEATSVPRRVDELVKQSGVVAIVSAHTLGISAINVDGHDVSRCVVNPLMASVCPAAELHRWHAEGGA